MRKDFGKHWPNEDIDNALGAKYFIAYFDGDGNKKVSLAEYEEKIKSDQRKMSAVRKKPDGRRRDPGVGWILDFNNDGIVSRNELDRAPDVLEAGPEALHKVPIPEKEL